MRIYKAGTPARCNRCEAKFDLPKDVEGYEFYSWRDRAARLQDFCTSPTCGHMDCHWIYKIDITES